MNFVLKNAAVYVNRRFEKMDISVTDGKISETPAENAEVIDCSGCCVLPGLIDVHTHMREPGFEYKETMKSGTLAAAAGGYTHICAMPNLNPVPDTEENIKKEIDIIKKDACINVYPYAAITVGEKGEKLTDMESLSAYAVAFSDDGRGVQSAEMMEQAMENAAELDKIIAAHCEDNDLLFGGYIHDGEYAKSNGHKGICSESEWKPIKRDLELAKKTACRYHVCHISAKESVELIRNAKKDGVSVTCETGPHYLVFSDEDLRDEGRFKMNPPIRSNEDRDALIEGIKDGTIDMIATDHAPHSAEEKSKGLEKSAMGIVGIETAFPVVYTKLVKTGMITLEQLVRLMHDNPMDRFGIGTDIKYGEKANITVFNIDEKYVINSDNFLSKGKSTPFEGMPVYGKCKLTICEGDIAWKENLTEN